ncbi:hypothetical protein O181_026372 [Austropuccinia psidii MF-1]|uniref:Integrase catalytic domain-containing protein n=1 Tax=Austropuccinia psidii MF-1 TaxID=1389203 RepID=A0A9Q3H0Q5_9BASI|nr:hypothetical protein [Austropuccinia psidii MF-1]
MKLAPKNQVPAQHTSIDQLSSSMSKLFVKKQYTNTNSQVRALRMPNEKEIEQAHLNIKLGNKQPSENLRKQHGLACHYCKSQDMPHVGHWVSTCPIIGDILKLEKAPPPMAVFEPAIRAVTGDRTASMVGTGSQVHFFHNGCSEKFRGNDIVIIRCKGAELCTATFENHGWFLTPNVPSLVIPAIKALTSNFAYKWHCRVGHVSDKVVRHFLKLYVPDFNQKHWVPFFCEHCSVCKSTRRRMKCADESLRDKPRDLMGPLPVPDIHLNRYLLTLQDHVSNFVFCFPIKTRDQIPKVLTDTFHLIKGVFNESVKFLQNDNAKEYTGQNFKLNHMALGTQQLFTSPYTPEQNGEAE